MEKESVQQILKLLKWFIISLLEVSLLDFSDILHERRNHEHSKILCNWFTWKFTLAKYETHKI